MAELNSGNDTRFGSSITIDIIDCKEKIKVYYTEVSFNEIENANQEELENIIENFSFL